jgi:hypothetical protein
MNSLTALDSIVHDECDIRYRFDVDSDILTKSNNSLRVVFDTSIDTGGRFMACTGGYDWAPWGTTWTVSPSVAAADSTGYYSKGSVIG